ncbi:MAG: hypothetical protein HGB05_09910, partial [Chloroflexi bacterium]|nr:hypothetical protein [Chloroflexota bacterium]
LTDEDGPYIELMWGVFTDNQPDFSWLMPYEERSFEQFVMPYHDLGVVTNATSSAKRWYHRAGQSARQQLQFVALHVIHLVIVAWLFRSGDWLFAIVFSIYLLLSAIVITRTPLYLQRPLALGLTCVAIVMGLVVFAPTPGLEWFIPLLFLKLLVSHVLREEPYLADQT